MVGDRFKKSLETSKAQTNTTTNKIVRSLTQSSISLSCEVPFWDWALSQMLAEMTVGTCSNVAMLTCYYDTPYWHELFFIGPLKL